MSKPIAIAKGIAFAFPDVCLTPIIVPVPIPYPNIALLNQAQDVAEDLLVGGDKVLLEDSYVPSSMGDEAGSVGGVKSGRFQGPCKITSASSSVVYGPDKKGIARFMDTSAQNMTTEQASDGNAVGFVLSAFPTVLVGG